MNNISELHPFSFSSTLEDNKTTKNDSYLPQKIHYPGGRIETNSIINSLCTTNLNANFSTFSSPFPVGKFIFPIHLGRLKDKGLSCSFASLEKLCQAIEQNQEELYQIKDIHYPAIFRGEMEEIESKTVNFELILQPPNKAYLLFADHKKKKNCLGKGAAKKISRLFCLHNPSVMACSMSRSTVDCQENQEANFLIQLNNQPHFPLLYEIFYCLHSHSKLQKKTTAFFQRQIIIMNYYPADLYTIAIAPDSASTSSPNNISDKKKYSLTLQILEAIYQLEQKKIIHRDIKLENILFAEDKIVLADFGFACQIDDKKSLEVRKGSDNYIAPEIFLSSSEDFGYAIDVWSAGCTLWGLWFGEGCPWWGLYKKFPEQKKIIKTFNSYTFTEDQPILFLFSKMLQFEPKERMTAGEAINFLKTKEELFVKEHTFCHTQKEMESLYNFYEKNK